MFNNMTRKDYFRGYRQKIKVEAMQVLGGYCKACGSKDYRVLQLDHIAGRPLFRLGTQQLYRFVVSNPEEAKKEYQLLCANCNWIKKWENNEHPHTETLDKKSW